MTDRIRIALRGPLRVTAPDGADLTPRAAKACGVLALLALAPGGTRPRRWLEEHLWSDRGPDQASGSLRQALSEIRRSLRPHDGALTADRREVTLRAEVALEGDGALVEGIGVRDPRFADWLERLRAEDSERRAPAPESAARPLMIRCSSPEGATGAALLGRIMAHQIGEGIAEQIRSRRLDGPGGPPPADVEVRCDVVESDGKGLAFLRVTHVPTAEVLHARRVPLDGPALAFVEGEAMARMAHEAAEITVGKLPQILGLDRAPLKATALARLALLRMFSHDAAGMAEADDLLSRAYEADTNGVYLAWRGLLRMIRTVEGGNLGLRADHEAAEADLCGAEERAGDNPTVHALAAQTREMMSDGAGAMSAAGRAVEMAPSNPMAVAALASAKSLAGRVEEAHALTRRALAFADRSRFRHWWEAHHCVACVAAGRLDEALAAGEGCVRSAPTMRSPHRHLLALYARRGDLEGADRMRRRLEEIEPGFALDRMLRDPDYPVRTLRRTGLLEAVGRLI